MARKPKNVNQIYSNKFRFSIKKLPTVDYFCIDANIPGVSIQKIQLDNPVNYRLVAGTKLFYEDLVLAFRVDEDLKNYKEIMKWMTGIGSPESTEEFRELIKNNNVGVRGYNIYSDATLMTLTNVSNVNISIIFKNLYPISLSGLDFSSRSPNPEPLFATVQFAFDSFTIE